MATRTKKKVVEDEKPKRPVGRPRKTNINKGIPREGIRDDPSNEEYVVELYYAYPMIFKKLSELYKALNAEYITINFTEDQVLLQTTSFSENIIIKTVIDCTNVHGYYCENPINVSINRQTFDIAVKRIDPKFFESIRLIIKDTDTEIHKMQIQLHNPSLDSTSPTDLSLVVDHQFEDTYSWDEDNYPVSFKFNKADFKKYIGDVDGVSNKFTITKPGSYPLYFEYKTEGENLSTMDPFPNEEKIGLESSIADPTIVAATIGVKEIKPISNAQIADEVRIYIANDHYVMIKMNMDEAVDTKILVKTASPEDDQIN